MDRDLLAALVASAATSTSATRHASPSPADETLPIAREWVRRWGPQPRLTSLPLCGCASGRCETCN